MTEGAEAKPRKRMGRPPKAPERGKRQNYTFRLGDKTRDLLVAEAGASGRSMSEEIEYIVEKHFLHREITEAAVRSAVREANVSIYGEGEGQKLLWSYAFVLRMAQVHTGKSFGEDPLTTQIVSQCFWLIWQSWYGDTDRDDITDKFGKKSSEISEWLASFTAATFGIGGDRMIAVAKLIGRNVFEDIPAK